MLHKLRSRSTSHPIPLGYRYIALIQARLPIQPIPYHLRPRIWINQPPRKQHLCPHHRGYVTRRRSGTGHLIRYKSRNLHSLLAQHEHFSLRSTTSQTYHARTKTRPTARHTTHPHPTRTNHIRPRRPNHLKMIQPPLSKVCK